MQRSDRWVAAGLALLGLCVLWTGSGFPAVPGQKFGAGFLPMIVGVGLMACAAALAWRGWRAADPASAADAPALRQEHFGSSLVIVAVIVGYIGLADRLGFLIVAPLCLIATLLALRVSWKSALLWALLGTLVVHLTFYKLLRVPLPWGVLRPLY